MLTRFRMDVVCTTVADAIEHAGGLICDRSLTGWDVRVFALDTAAGDADVALRILGAARADDMPEDPADDPLLRAVLVSGEMYRTDDNVRRWVDAVLAEPLVEVLTWDTGRPAPDVRRVEIPVSRAATAFLGHARVQVGAQPASATSELYCQLKTGRIQRRFAQMITVTTGVQSR